MARKRKRVARSKNAKKIKLTFENTTALGVGVGTESIMETGAEGVLRKHENPMETDESAGSVTTLTRTRAAASAARTKIKENIFKEDDADADLETSSDDSDIEVVSYRERVCSKVVKKGLNSLHALTMSNLQTVRKEAHRGTRNVDIFNPSYVSNLPRDQQIKHSWISVEALEKIRKLEIHSDEYGKTAPKPDVLLPAPYQDEESPSMVQTPPPQNVEPVLQPVTSIPCEATVIFVPPQDKDRQLASPTIILPQDKDPFYYFV